MCLNEKCFNFLDFSGKKVAVVISGPGYLEYPWALETAQRLKNSGAFVTVFDISDYALRYAMRLSFYGLRLPIATRKVLRKILLVRKSLIENSFAHQCSKNNILYRKLKSKKSLHFALFKKNLQLNSLIGVRWGELSALEIAHSFLSSKAKKNLQLTDFVSATEIYEIKSSILETTDFARGLDNKNYDSFFVANGRQPVSAALTTYLRGSGKIVQLYESAGGYIFQGELTPCLDYFDSSPANPVELQKKIMCNRYLDGKNIEQLEVVMDRIISRKSIAFGLDYLTDSSFSFDSDLLSSSRNYAFFTTTDWEISVLYKHVTKDGNIGSQKDAVTAILSLISESDKLFIRLHPSDPGNQSDADSYWKDFTHDSRVILIDSHSRLNSYELAEKMNANFVWTSFLGFELSLRKLPVAVLGEAFYGPVLANNWIRTEKDLRKYISHPTNVESQDLHRYANYLAFGGFPIMYSRVDSNRKIFIDNFQVDIFKKAFSWLPEKYRLAIS